MLAQKIYIAKDIWGDHWLSFLHVDWVLKDVQIMVSTHKGSHPFNLSCKPVLSTQPVFPPQPHSTKTKWFAPSPPPPPFSPKMVLPPQRNFSPPTPFPPNNKLFFRPPTPPPPAPRAWFDFPPPPAGLVGVRVLILPQPGGGTHHPQDVVQGAGQQPEQTRKPPGPRCFLLGRDQPVRRRHLEKTRAFNCW